MAAHYQLLIDGRWTDAVSGMVFASHNPATGEHIADVAEAGRGGRGMRPSARPGGRSTRARGRAWTQQRGGGYCCRWRRKYAPGATNSR